MLQIFVTYIVINIIDNFLIKAFSLIGLTKLSKTEIALPENALLKIANYLNSCQKKLIFSGMIKSQFSYCPLIWMFSSRKSNNLINRLHERSIRI